MARTKNYIEEEVIEKAMNLFWRNGYETTSTRMLEKEMGINQFSIYSSFGSKQGVFLESIKCYEKKIKDIKNKLKSSTDCIGGIKQYFYDFIAFSAENGSNNGCMITNAAMELNEQADPLLMNEVVEFTGRIRNAFLENLMLDKTKSEETLEREANYLIGAMMGLSVATKVFSPKQLSDFVETAFEQL